MLDDMIAQNFSFSMHRKRVIYWRCDMFFVMFAIDCLIPYDVSVTEHVPHHAVQVPMKHISIKNGSFVHILEKTVFLTFCFQNAFIVSFLK